MTLHSYQIANLHAAHIPDVLASMIHDIKNRLFDVGMALGEDNPDLGSLNEAILESAGRMDRMLTAYRLLRQESHASLAVMSDVNLRDWVEDVLLQAPFQSGTINLDVKMTYSDNWVLSRELVTDILANGLRNAMRYAKERIHISVRLDPLDWLMIEINDDGPGFQQPDSDAGIRGIGLYVAKKIMALHRGSGYRGTLTIENGGALHGALLQLRFPPLIAVCSTSTEGIAQC